MSRPLVFLITAFFFSKTSLGQTPDSIVLPNAVIYYYTYGTGEPVILLSGGPGIAAHQEDDAAIALSHDFKAILFDQRGTGASWTAPFDSTTINVDQAVADIEILRRHLKLNKLNLYGHSWGSLMWQSVRQKKKLVDLTLNRFKGASLIVYSWQDPIGLTTLTQYLQFLPNAEVRGIHRCGHFPGTEQPEEYFGILINFLNKHLKGR